MPSNDCIQLAALLIPQYRTPVQLAELESRLSEGHRLGRIVENLQRRVEACTGRLDPSGQSGPRIETAVSSLGRLCSVTQDYMVGYSTRLQGHHRQTLAGIIIQATLFATQDTNIYADRGIAEIPYASGSNNPLRCFLGGSDAFLQALEGLPNNELARYRGQVREVLRRISTYQNVDQAHLQRIRQRK